MPDSRVDAAEFLLSAHRKRSWFVWRRAASNIGVYLDSKDYYEQRSHLSLCICSVAFFYLIAALLINAPSPGERQSNDMSSKAKESDEPGDEEE